MVYQLFFLIKDISIKDFCYIPNGLISLFLWNPLQNIIELLMDTIWAKERYLSDPKKPSLHLFVSPAGRPAVCPSVRPSIRLSVHTSTLISFTGPTEPGPQIFFADSETPRKSITGGVIRVVPTPLTPL